MADIVQWQRWESWRPPGGPYAWQVRELIRVVLGLHSTFKREIWLWRGQSRADYTLEPGMHSRVRTTVGLEMREDHAANETALLIEAARRNRLDRVEGLQLPDLALLAHLQHHGAATPLLDVTVDPLVGLWMVAHASGVDPRKDDESDGALFGIRRPRASRWIAPLDSRPYRSEDSSVSDISSELSGGVCWYRPPDISERLRIQRGSFLIGSLAGEDQVTIPVRWKSDPASRWLRTRLNGLGRRGRPTTALTDVVVFRVPSHLKSLIRGWLEDRAGLTQQVIYPTPWHRPFLEDFCRSYSRSRVIDIRRGLETT
jgi:hypothetical protein